MSDLGFNKIAFCVLGTGLALIGLNEASHAFFPHTEHAKEGYAIAIPETTAPGETTNAVAEGPRDYFKLISAGDVEAGKQVAVKCQQCHKFEAGAESTGPSLFGMIGRKIASEPGFKYTTGPGSLTAYGEQAGTWTYENFDRYIEAPKKAVPGTAMNFIGIKKQQDRANLMTYLRTLTTGEPLPLPEPLPEQPVDAAAQGATPTDPSQPSQGEAGTPAPTPGQPAPAVPATPAPAQPTQH
jgi:cytochrome c